MLSYGDVSPAVPGSHARAGRAREMLGTHGAIDCLWLARYVRRDDACLTADDATQERAFEGVFATAQGLGGALGNVAAGILATAFGFSATFLTLAAVAGETCAAAGRATAARAGA